MFVAFVVVVVMLGVPWDCISVLLFCCCALTNPECAILNVRHTTNAGIAYDKRKIVVLGIYSFIVAYLSMCYNSVMGTLPCIVSRALL
jgi:hypothetical protein